MSILIINAFGQCSQLLPKTYSHLGPSTDQSSQDLWGWAWASAWFTHLECESIRALDLCAGTEAEVGLGAALPGSPELCPWVLAHCEPRHLALPKPASDRLSRCHQLMEALKEQEEINFRLRQYMDKIILAILDHNPSILEIKH